MSEPKIIRNAAECRKCGDVIESRTRHDFVYCSCRAIFVDGGTVYLRWGGSLKDLIDRSELDPPQPRVRDPFWEAPS